MEKAFWLEKWQKNEIGFHNPQAHPLLVKYFPRLDLPAGSRIFLPLCGKTLDIGWLMAQGLSVCGAELSEDAIVQLFEKLEIEPCVSPAGPLKRYSAEGIEIFVGDIFQLRVGDLGAVDAIYDRAALVALPDSMREQYANHLVQITAAAPQLLISFDYDQKKMPGPPFCVNVEEVDRIYSENYMLTLIDSVDVAGGLKGKCRADEQVWLLQSR